MEGKIPDAMMGDYSLSLEELMPLIRKQKDIYQEQKEKIHILELAIKNMTVSLDEWDDLKMKIPTWQDVFLNADTATKRVLINRLIERIDIKKDEIIIRFKISLDEFFPRPIVTQPRMNGDHGVPEPPFIRDLRSVILDELIIKEIQKDEKK